MKAFISKTVIAVCLSILCLSLHGFHVEADAKTYDMKSSFAKDLKKGTMPRLKGKVGMSYKTLKKKEPKGRGFVSDRFNFYQLKDTSQSRDLYGFHPNEKLAANDKVVIILRTYNYLISSKSVEKYFGKPYKAIDMYNEVTNSYVYKAGKYYVLVYPDKRSNTTDVYVGTKTAILNSMLYKKIYR